MAIRSAQKGYLEAVTKEVLAWHQHINATGAHRDPRTQYLIARNYLFITQAFLPNCSDQESHYTSDYPSHSLFQGYTSTRT